ncbi:lmo0937 family membrane protein [Chromobacterium sphagni]|nr:lmo0937 family membrane protein [Chromobacterium sphagni]
MFETIIVLLLVLWALGLLTAFTMGGLIHILLLLAVVAILVRFIQGRPL